MRLARLFEAFILFAIILGLTPLHPTAAPCWARCASTRSAVRRRSMIQRGMANATVHCRSSIPSAMVRPRTGRTSAAATPPKLNGTNHGQKSLKYAGHLAYATCAARGCGSLHLFPSAQGGAQPSALEYGGGGYAASPTAGTRLAATRGSGRKLASRSVRPRGRLRTRACRVADRLRLDPSRGRGPVPRVVAASRGVSRTVLGISGISINYLTQTRHASAVRTRHDRHALYFAHRPSGRASGLISRSALRPRKPCGASCPVTVPLLPPDGSRPARNAHVTIACALAYVSPSHLVKPYTRIACGSH